MEKILTNKHDFSRYVYTFVPGTPITIIIDYKDNIITRTDSNYVCIYDGTDTIYTKTDLTDVKIAFKNLLAKCGNIYTTNVPKFLYFCELNAYKVNESVIPIDILSNLLDNRAPSDIDGMIEYWLQYKIPQGGMPIKTNLRRCEKLNELFFTCLVNKLTYNSQMLKLFYDVYVPFQWVMKDLISNGMLIDKDEILSYRDTLQAEIDELTIAMCELLDIPFEVTHKLGAGSKVIASQELKEDISNDSKYLELLKSFKQKQKIMNSFVNTMLEVMHVDGRIRAEYSDIVSNSGRIYTRNPNIQGVVKENCVRRLFIPQEGYRYIVADFNSVELRLLFSYTGRNAFAERLMASPDIFQEIADSKRIERDTVKTDIYKSLYKWGYKESEYYKLLGKQKLEDIVMSQLSDYSHVKTLTGRKRYFKKQDDGTYSYSDLCAAFNHMIQSLAADIMRKTLLMIKTMQKKYPQYDIKIVACIHDEVVLECRKSSANIVANKVKDIMESFKNLDVPMKAKVEVRNNYAE